MAWLDESVSKSALVDILFAEILPKYTHTYKPVIIAEKYSAVAFFEKKR